MRQRGARVITIDKRPLDSHLLHDQGIEFIHYYAFRYRPKQPVEWLVCDVMDRA